MIDVLKRKQVIDDEILEGIERVVQKAREGRVTEIVFVAHDVDSGHFERIAGFMDGWRLLGALEYARATVKSGFMDD